MNLLLHPKNKKQVEAIISFAKALNINFEIEKPYNSSFVKEILQAKQDIAEGKGVKIKTEDLWK